MAVEVVSSWRKLSFSVSTTCTASSIDIWPTFWRVAGEDGAGDDGAGDNGVGDDGDEVGDDTAGEAEDTRGEAAGGLAVDCLATTGLGAGAVVAGVVGVAGVVSVAGVGDAEAWEVAPATGGLVVGPVCTGDERFIKLGLVEARGVIFDIFGDEADLFNAEFLEVGLLGGELVVGSGVGVEGMTVLCSGIGSILRASGSDDTPPRVPKNSFGCGFDPE